MTINNKKSYKWILFFRHSLLYFLIALLLFSILFFLMSLLNETSKKLSLAQRKIREEQCLLENIVSLTNEKKEAKKYYQSLNSLLPSEDDILFLSHKIEEISSGKDIKVNFDFKGTGEKNHLKAFVVNFSLVGSEEGILDFFKEVEKLPFFFSIEKFNLSREGEGEGKEKIILSGSGLIFLKKGK